MLLKHYTTHYTAYTWERINPSTPNICLVNKFGPSRRWDCLSSLASSTNHFLFFPSLLLWFHLFLVSEPSFSLVLSQTSNPHDDFPSSLTGPQIAASHSISSFHLERGQQRQGLWDKTRGPTTTCAVGEGQKGRVNGRSRVIFVH